MRKLLNTLYVTTPEAYLSLQIFDRMSWVRCDLRQYQFSYLSIACS